jgi:multidrug resistance efflux pump
MKTRSLKNPSVILAICASLVLAAFALAATTAPDPSAPPTTAVHKGALNLSLDLEGVFEPRGADEVRIKVRRNQGDFVVKKVAAPGAKVSKGDLLLELDATKIDQQIAAADNELKLAQANLAKAQSDVTLGAKGDDLAMNNAKQDLANAQKILKRWDDIDGPAVVTTNTLRTKEADTEVDNQTDELDQLHKMYKSEDLTSATADIVVKRAVRALELGKISASLMHIAADRAVQLDAGIQRQGLESGVNEKAQNVAQLEAVQSQARVVRDTSLATARAAADEAAEKLAELKGDRGIFSVASTVDGVVVYGSFGHKAWTEIEPAKLAAGESVLADQVLLTVYVPGQLSLETSWPENDLERYIPAAKVMVTPAALPDISYDGALGNLSPVGAGQAFDVPVELPAVDVRLAPGFKANVDFDGGKLENVLLVPATAVSHGKVWVVKDGKDQPVPVVVGASDGQEVQIKSGLNEGDVVLITAKTHPAAQ